MTIHKEGYTSIALCILFIFVINAVVHYFLPDTTWVHWTAYIFSFVLFIIILQFFRSPRINVSALDSHVICPADGKVVVIEETEETEFLKDRRIQLSIFMSPINVHVNRYPIGGIVKYFK
jgi:phosphatidylserine decarboxylase